MVKVYTRGLDFLIRVPIETLFLPKSFLDQMSFFAKSIIIKSSRDQISDVSTPLFSISKQTLAKSLSVVLFCKSMFVSISRSILPIYVCFFVCWYISFYPARTNLCLFHCLYNSLSILPIYVGFAFQNRLNVSIYYILLIYIYFFFIHKPPLMSFYWGYQCSWTLTPATL